MTDAPIPGWYADPEVEGRLRYWDGAQWTEHVAAPEPQAPAATPPPTAPLAPPFARYSNPIQPHVTLFSNPYEKPARTKRRALEDSLSVKERVQAAAIDASLAIPFVVVAFVLGPVLGWISGNSSSQNHAYHGAAIVVAVVLGLSLLAWNFLVREITLGTAYVLSLKKQAP